MYQEKPPSDAELLERLLDSPKLEDSDRQVFEGMVRQLAAKGCLSPKQREWCQNVYTRLGLEGEEPCANLFSRGVGLPRRELPKFAFEGLPLPDKPPGRR